MSDHSTCQTESATGTEADRDEHVVRALSADADLLCCLTGEVRAAGAQLLGAFQPTLFMTAPEGGGLPSW